MWNQFLQIIFYFWGNLYNFILFAKTIFQYNYHPSGKTLYIDARDEQTSNWMRWVNSARWEEEQNMFPVEHAGAVYYLLIKDVYDSDELLGNWFLNKFEFAFYLDIFKNWNIELLKI